MIDGVAFQKLGTEFTGGLLIGVVTGIAARKLVKLVAVIVGILVALFKFLESRQVLEVNWERLTAGVLELGGSSNAPPSWLMTVLSTVSISAGFAGGFLVGFRRG